jgi:hypothetical protein
MGFGFGQVILKIVQTRPDPLLSRFRVWSLFFNPNPTRLHAEPQFCYINN